MPRPRPNGNVNITGKLLYGFPLWGKAFPAGWVALPYNADKNTAPNRKVRGGIFIGCST